jgi:N-methylhydantoinase A/oxoprolinase/acetone carboxylase beta subunit
VKLRVEKDPMPNITLAIDQKLLKSARAYARRNGTTVNALVRQRLQQLIDEEAQREEARLGLIALMESSTGRMKPGFKVNRDEMYGSPALSRHQHSHLRGGRKKG